MTNLHEHFFNILNDKNVCIDCQESIVKRCVKDIIDTYSQPDRHYHNLNHIIKCLDQVTSIFDNPMYPLNDEYIRYGKLLKIAILYHDYVYRLYNHNNEKESANIARAAMICCGYSQIRNVTGPSDIDIVTSLILSTTHDPLHLPTYHDGIKLCAKIMCDIDLYQLGSDYYDFWYNEDLIRKEYAVIPEEMYQPERCKILKRFLDRGIYYTKSFGEKHELKARYNIQSVLAKQTIFSVD